MAPQLSDRLVRVSEWNLMRFTPLFSFLQMECIEECGITPPTTPGKLADEENNPPRRHHHRSPQQVSSACFLTTQYIYMYTLNYSIKRADALAKKWKMLVALPQGSVYILMILVSLSVCRRKTRLFQLSTQFSSQQFIFFFGFSSQYLIRALIFF